MLGAPPPSRNNARKDIDPFAKAMLYRLRRDALMVVSNLNRGRAVETSALKRQVVFIQSQLLAAAVADPSLSEEAKAILVQFHAATVSQDLQDRRGTKRRAPDAESGGPTL